MIIEPNGKATKVVPEDRDQVIPAM
jgi:hypothetical protein